MNQSVQNCEIQQNKITDDGEPLVESAARVSATKCEKENEESNIMEKTAVWNALELKDHDTS